MNEPGATTGRARKWTARRLAFFAGGLLLLALLSIAAGGLWLESRLHGSLPRLDGDLILDCLEAPARIDRDAAGVPVIVARSRRDLACATGFAHGQDRFFQMDTQRREPAGELAAVFGKAALNNDRAVRLHRFRTLAQRAYAAEPADRRALLDAYAAGVNAALAQMAAPPPEYLAFRARPEPWRPEDTFLVSAAMYRVLQDSGGWSEEAYGAFAAATPPELFAFLVPRGSSWDAPLVGDALAPAPVPGADVVDLRERAPGDRVRRRPPDESRAAPDEYVIGSNNWAVAASHSADGRAWVANDMHLPLSLPNIWYRAELRVEGGDEPSVRLAGATLPGTPALVAGSNGAIAWGFTNCEGDFSDLVVVERAPGNPDAYRTPDGDEPFETFREAIQVKGGKTVVDEVRWTRWGPVLREDANGRLLVLSWTAHRPEGLNLGLIELERATSVGGALAAAPRVGIPHQNVTIADAAGSIGWTVAGAIPRRRGFDGRLPQSWADGSVGWDGWVEGSRPQVMDPPSGKIWTANNRVADEAGLRVSGARYALGARAKQIRDGLLERGDAVTRDDLLTIQLDDRALFLSRWRDLLLRTLQADSEKADSENGRARLTDLVERTWTGRATPDSAAFRLVRAFRLYVGQAVLAPFEVQIDEDRRVSPSRLSSHTEQPVWTLVTEQPPHLLDPQFADWQALLLSAADRVVTELLLDDDGAPVPEERATWGARNRIGLGHPLSGVVPQLSVWLDIPAQPMSGGAHMPKVLIPGFGASERFAVSPGREESAYYHQPGGASGHFLSPFYRAGHADWVAGEPTPLLPGPAVHTLELQAP